MVPMIGTAGDIREAEEYKYKHFFSYEIKIGYKISNSVYPAVRLSDGPPYNEQQSKIDHQINNSIVGSLSLIYNFPRKG